LTDYEEIFIYGTSPHLVDSDGDGACDLTEIFVTFTNPGTDGDFAVDGDDTHSTTLY
jgi:hypothetical protein